jgi:hypothetical protein
VTRSLPMGGTTCPWRVVSVPPSDPLVGFQRWAMVSDGLESLLGPDAWRGVMEAQCRFSPSRFGLGREPHKAPDAGCGCGIHAQHDRDFLFNRMDRPDVDGIVSLWGSVAISEHDVRGEFARIEALALSPDESLKHSERLERFAQELGVQVVPASKLSGLAERFGRLTPEEWRRGSVGPRLVSLPRRTVSQRNRPAFRFTFSEDRGYIYPWGWSGGRVGDRRVEGCRGAVGDVFAPDDDHAVATFAYVHPDLRDVAERHLRSWTSRTIGR